MSQPSAKVILDSISPEGHRLTTLEVVMHRFVLAEFNTHRVFSRNSASSRAIPVEKMIKRAIEDPAMPMHWGKNQKGMQAERELDESEQHQAKVLWLQARDMSIAYARNLLSVGVHKQITNRLLEPFLWHTAIVSSTQWNNFFKQRCSPLAMPEIRLVAEAIRTAMESSTPQRLTVGEWHTPYIQPEESFDLQKRIEISVARCARVSYLTQDGKRDPAEDVTMFQRLANADPPHASPFEHVATPRDQRYNPPLVRTSNFVGWQQYREMVFGDMNPDEKTLVSYA